MSAQATFTETLTRRSSRYLETVAACGPLPALLVALGGAGVGFFLWYVAITHVRVLEAGGDITFVLAMAAGLALSFGGWVAYAEYFAHRAGVGAVTALRWDSVSWAMLALFPAGTFLPLGLGAPARAAAVAAALFAFVKIIVGSRFVQTVRDVAFRSSPLPSWRRQ